MVKNMEENIYFCFNKETRIQKQDTMNPEWTNLRKFETFNLHHHEPKPFVQEIL